MRYLVLILIVSVGFTSCKDSSTEEIVTTIISPSRELDDFGDGIFFTNISISSDQDEIYIVNRNPAILYILDKNFNLKRTIESVGDGPGDLSHPIHLFLNQQELMIEDFGNHRISVFEKTSGEFVEQINIPEVVGQWRFFYEGDQFYFPLKGYQADSISVLKVNRNGEVNGRLGLSMPQLEDSHNRQSRLIQPFKPGKILLIGVNLPFLDILDVETGELVKRHRWDKFEPLKRALDSLERDFTRPDFQRNPKEIKHVVIDAEFANGKLYLSFTDRIGMDRTKARQLLEFEINEKDIKLNHVFRLETGNPDETLHPNAFHIDAFAGKIYTQGLITRKIYVFDLPQ